MRDMKRRGPRTSQQSSNGQALVEFALIAPLFFLLMFAVIQFGFLMGGQIGFTNGVRETARYASTIPTATTTQVRNELVNNQLPKAIPGYRSANLVGGSTTVSYCYYPNPNNTASFPSYSERVIVTAVYRHPLFVPIVSAIIDRIDGIGDNALSATAREEMRVENPRITSIPGGAATC
jgi:Flp pilus assembly protein TadG